MPDGCGVKPISCGAPKGCSRRPWAVRCDSGVHQFLRTLQNDHCFKDSVKIDWEITQNAMPVQASTTNGGSSYSITAIPLNFSESTPRPSAFDEYIQQLPYWERLLFSDLDMKIDCDSLVQQFTDGPSGYDYPI
eukprot:3872742-Ditylum_brightwellii.AAC.1